jgi:hypothetical protein
MHVSLKRSAGAEAEARALRAMLTPSSMPLLPAQSPRAPRAGQVGRDHSSQRRARIVAELSAAVYHARALGVVAAVHPTLVALTPAGAVLIIGAAPDARFEPPEGRPCASWALGCVLLKLITGRPPVHAGSRDASRDIARCIGAPSLAECHELGVRCASSRPRRAVRGATLAERRVLVATLTWDPRRLLPTPRGLAALVETIAEGEPAP